MIYGHSRSGTFIGDMIECGLSLLIVLIPMAIVFYIEYRKRP